MNPISVLIADDHEIVRYGISTFLSSAEDIEIVGEASSGEECLELFNEKKPEVCLLDIGMPDKNGIETAKSIRSLDDDTKILILSMHIDKEILSDVLEADINGYLLKNTDKSDILNGIRAVVKGQQIYSDPISDLIKQSFRKRKEKQKKHNDIEITSREQEILQLVVEGYTSQEIADKLFISPRTVSTHRSNLMQKLELKNIADLVRYAIENDLVKINQ